MIPLGQQIAELEREAALRRQVYPGLIARGKMRASEAEMHRTRLDAAIATLKWLERNETAVRTAVAPPRATGDGDELGRTGTA